MSSRRIRFSVIIFTVFFFLNGTSLADAIETVEAISWQNHSLGPLKGRNQAPLLNLFYTLSPEKAETMGEGRKEFRLDLDVSNISNLENTGDSILIYDMEIYRPSLHYSYGLSDDADLHLEIPFLAFNGGVMDGAIQDFHEFFGMPNGGRERIPDYGFGYSLVLNGNEIFEYSASGLDLSDVDVDVKWQINKQGAVWPSLAIRAGVKFPTGKFDRGKGSGEFDYAFGITISRTIRRFFVFAGYNLSIIKVPHSLNGLIVEDIRQYFAGAEYMAIQDKLSLVVQLEGQNTPYTRTGLKTLDKDILELVAGFRGLLRNERLIWQLSMREDLEQYSTVDFTLSFSMGARY